tara:strand:- start:1290 stop:2258 length:969 start_codon:yes stop_codon:yes gene_type:complete
MTTLNIIDATNFTPSTQISYKDISVNAKGGKSIRVMNSANRQQLYLQTPLMLTWGINKWVDEFSGRVSYDFVLQFPREEYATAETTAFLNNMKELEQKMISDAIENSREWFNKSSMSPDVAETLFTPVLKYPKDKETKEIDYNRAPTFKVKLGCWDSNFDCELYNLNSKRVFPPDNVDSLDTEAYLALQERTLMDLVSKGCNISTVVKCKGVWFANGSFGINWLLVQAVVQPKATFKGRCHISLSSTDRETLLKASEDVNNDGDGEVVDDVAVDDSDEEEDTHTPAVTATIPDEVAAEVAVEVAPKKKKRVVKKKKVVATET